MGQATGGTYDPPTVEMLRTVLDEAWTTLSPAEQSLTSKTELAERILRLAATGERDPDRLRTGALKRPPGPEGPRVAH